MRRSLLILSVLATVGAVPLGLPLAAQNVRVIAPTRGRISMVSSDAADRAMIGVSTSSGGKRDTLGVLVSALTDGGPAEKSGIVEGDRIQSINGVSLKVSRDDAGDDEMGGIMQRRLTRELGKLKAGDEVTLQLWHDGASKSLKVKTVAAEELSPRRRTAKSAEERAVIGISFGLTGSKRDTLGAFVNAVTEGGPAEKAGIVEGDRIAAVNGASLKVSKDDMDDDWGGGMTLNRLSREVAKAKVGDVLDLTIISGGRSRSVKVTTVKASSLKGFEQGGFTFMRTPMPAMAPMPPMPPMPPMDFHELRGELHGDVQGEVLRELRTELPRIRVELQRGLEQAQKELSRTRRTVRVGTVRM